MIAVSISFTASHIAAGLILVGFLFVGVRFFSKIIQDM